MELYGYYSSSMVGQLFPSAMLLDFYLDNKETVYL